MEQEIYLHMGLIFLQVFSWELLGLLFSLTLSSPAAM